jgi:hypothetical protein
MKNFESVPPVLAALALFLSAPPAEAYLGPGSGLMAVATFVGIVAAVVVALIGFLWFPLKRLLSKRKGEKAEASRHASEEE